MNNKFHILLSSDLTYEKLIAEVYYDDDLIAVLNQDQGSDRLKLILLPAPSRLAHWSLPYSEFIKVLDLAKKELISSKKMELLKK